MMSRLVFKTLIAGTLLAISWFPGTALASGSGTSAWVLKSTALYSGPGSNYPGTAIDVQQGQSVTVSRCSLRWCQIANTNGWLSMDNLSFGQAAKGPFSGPKFEIERGGDGEVCFYDGVNYSGASFCLPSGATSRDLVLLGWDNKISSISVGEGVSVRLCRDRNFTSYCATVIKDTPALERFLGNAVSSYMVH
ncbi:MAG: peptidase inhibitor family I36 protein [Devosiaceae bacterium]|nr:peptidase inhibitor family I36 protein [Devosiaceae bacterium]